MRPFQRTLLSAAILLLASASIAQEIYHTSNSDLMARLSYDNSGIASPGSVRHVCVAVSHDGQYRVVRSLPDGQTQRMSGKMQKEEFSQLSALLGTADFRSLTGNHAGLIRQEAKKFAAEIPLDGQSRPDGSEKSLDQKAWRLQWLNADDESPFPAPVSKVVDWLQHFQPKDGKTFEYTEYQDVCPAGGLRLLQPSMATNSNP